MSYIDPKEEVISLELTPYGRYLLSRGRLKPVYYAFFDDDIIYDLSYANVDTEFQSQIEKRIQEETPRLKAQGVTTGRETDILNQTKLYTPDGTLLADDIYEFLTMGPAFSQENFITDEVNAQKLYSALTPQPLPSEDTLKWRPLGSYNVQKGFAPAWSMTFLRGEISSSVAYLETSGSKGVSYDTIPQINSEIEYKIQRNNRAYNVIKEPENLSGEVENPLGSQYGVDKIDKIVYQDLSTVAVVRDYLIIRLEEANSFYEQENFEMELFEVTEDSNTGEEKLAPLKFFNNSEAGSETILSSEGFNIDPLTVEYYFDCLVDSEIDPAVICPLIKRDDTKQFYISKIFDCEEADLNTGNIVDVYADEDDTKDICE